MHQHDQDIIDDFLLEIATSGLALRGTFLDVLIRRAIDGCPEPTCQEAAGLVPQELLNLAREWKKRPDEVLARLEATRFEPGKNEKPKE